MKKILLSIVAGLALASCGSMQQAAAPSASTSAPATSTSTETEATTTETTEVSAPAATTNQVNAASALSSIIGGLAQSANQATTTVSESYTAGQQSGVSLKALYNQYKADGKLDFSNLSNITNILNVSAQVQKLTSAEKDSVNYSDFSKGLIEGSLNLINDLNVEQVTETLVSQLGSIDTTKITETADKAQTAVSNISSTASSIATSASSIMEVLNLFKQQ